MDSDSKEKLSQFLEQFLDKVDEEKDDPKALASQLYDEMEKLGMVTCISDFSKEPDD